MEQAPESHPSTGKAACVGAFEPALSPAGVVPEALVQEFGLQLMGRKESQPLRNATGKRKSRRKCQILILLAPNPEIGRYGKS